MWVISDLGPLINDGYDNEAPPRQMIQKGSEEKKTSKKRGDGG